MFQYTKSYNVKKKNKLILLCCKFKASILSYTYILILYINFNINHSIPPPDLIIFF